MCSARAGVNSHGDTLESTPLAWLHDEHGNGTLAHEMARRAAEQPAPQPPLAICGHDHEIACVREDVPYDLDEGIAD